MFFIIVGVLLATLGTWAGIYSNCFRHFLCGMCLTSISALIALYGCFIISNPVITNSLEAEPLAHNQTQTVFATEEGTYLADGLYPDGTYLLTVDGKDVLVVWQAVDGENG